MAEHTKGPWRVGSSGRTVSAGFGQRVATITDRDEAGTNARRICAAVNACEGIPSAALEAGVVKDLLAACEAVDNHLKTTFPPYAPGESPFDLVRAALATGSGRSTGRRRRRPTP